MYRDSFRSPCLALLGYREPMPFLLSSGVHVWISLVPPMCLSLDVLEGNWSVTRSRGQQSNSETHILQSSHRPRSHSEPSHQTTVNRNLKMRATVWGRKYSWIGFQKYGLNIHDGFSFLCEAAFPLPWPCHLKCTTTRDFAATACMSS